MVFQSVFKSTFHDFVLVIDFMAACFLHESFLLKDHFSRATSLLEDLPVENAVEIKQ